MALSGWNLLAGYLQVVRRREMPALHAPLNSDSAARLTCSASRGLDSCTCRRSRAGAHWLRGPHLGHHRCWPPAVCLYSAGVQPGSADGAAGATQVGEGQGGHRASTPGKPPRTHHTQVLTHACAPHQPPHTLEPLPLCIVQAERVHQLHPGLQPPQRPINLHPQGLLPSSAGRALMRVSTHRAPTHAKTGPTPTPPHTRLHLPPARPTVCVLMLDTGAATRSSYSSLVSSPRDWSGEATSTRTRTIPWRRRARLGKKDGLGEGVTGASHSVFSYLQLATPQPG